MLLLLLSLLLKLLDQHYKKEKSIDIPHIHASLP